MFEKSRIHPGLHTRLQMLCHSGIIAVFSLMVENKLDDFLKIYEHIFEIFNSERYKFI